MEQISALKESVIPHDRTVVLDNSLSLRRSFGVQAYQA